MTVAATLMAAGADQQLIAAKLQESHEIDKLSAAEPDEPAAADEPVQTATKSSDGGLSIAHEAGETLEDIANKVKAQDQQEAAAEAEQELAEHISTVAPAAPPVIEVPTTEPPVIGGVDWKPGMDEPSLGGTLNATTEQAEEDTRREEEDDKNKTILTHSYLGESAPTYNTPVNSAEETNTGESSVDIFAGTPPQDAPVNEAGPVGETVIQPLNGPSLADIDAKNRQAPPVEPAAPVAEPTVPPAAPAPVDINSILPPPPPLPDFSTLPPPPIAPAYALDPTPQPAPERLGDILAPEQPPAAPQPEQPPVPPTDNNDPGQFKIPGQ